jgi:hypothetical protein
MNTEKLPHVAGRLLIGHRRACSLPSASQWCVLGGCGQPSDATALLLVVALVLRRSGFRLSTDHSKSPTKPTKSSRGYQLERQGRASRRFKPEHVPAAEVKSPVLPLHSPLPRAAHGKQHGSRGPLAAAVFPFFPFHAHCRTGSGVRRVKITGAQHAQEWRVWCAPRRVRFHSGGKPTDYWWRTVRWCLAAAE